MRTPAPPHFHLAIFVIFFTAVCAASVFGGAIRAGFDSTPFPANDDGHVGPIPLGFTINFFGTDRTSIYVNNNGNVSFRAGLGDFPPDDTAWLTEARLAPFWADVDTTGEGSGIVRYGPGSVDGRSAFGVNWINVGYYADHVDKLNSFQLVIIERSDRGAGQFDVEFNYDNVLWETGDASVGTSGIEYSAKVGYSDGGTNRFELPGSGVNRALLNSNAITGLINGSRNSSVLGRYVFNFPAQNRVTSVTYEQIATDDLPIDANPNANPNDPNQERGRRIFPDDKVPDDPVDRRKIRVKAQYGVAAAGQKIYFRSFDVDDPSADTSPIDTNDSPTIKGGDDNNGTVDGTAATKAGKLSIAAGGDCGTYAAGIWCRTDQNGVATVEFTTTMQPGDNFAVAASASESYLPNVTLAPDGINLRDTAGITIPVTTQPINGCVNGNVGACRAEMLTVWRRIHLEVDSMGNVGSGNNVTGTITQAGFAQGNCTNPGPTPSPTPTPGPGPTPVPCTPDATGFFVTPDSGQQIEDGRFMNGRVVVGNRYYFVRENTPTTLILRGVDGIAFKTSAGKQFTLYDDDDFNNDDNLVNGDFNDSITGFQDSLKYLLSEDGFYPDNKPKNVLARSYIRPEYAWAAQYNQSNLPFSLNVAHTSAVLSGFIDPNRGSRTFERDDFWIGYLIFAYQGPSDSDFDGATNSALESGALGVGLNAVCDCYGSSNCPSGGTICHVNGNPVFPHGGQFSLVYQEVLQDYTDFFLNPFVYLSPLAPRTLDEKRVTPAHEIGHQFGLSGDQVRATFMIMDYADYNRNGSPDPVIAFHPEHINIMRRRIKSPGQQ